MSANYLDDAVRSDMPARNLVKLEQDFLGCLLKFGAAAWEKVSPPLTVDDFGLPTHKLVYGAVAELAAAGKQHNPLDVSLHLNGKLPRDFILSRLVNETLATSADEVVKLAKRLRDPLAADLLDLTPVSSWASQSPPAPREWIWENFIPAGRVTSFGGDGGQGKTTIAIQIGVHHATGRALYGHGMKAGKVLGIFCEDEQDELERRVRAACNAEGINLADVGNFVALSRDGQQNMLCSFERDVMVPTPFYHQLEATIAAFRPDTLILDVTADFFAGDFMSTPHVRQFIKVALGAWCVRYSLAVLLLAHPSATGLNSGEGDGFSRAWNNTVRSRFFLRRPKAENPEDATDRRLLEVKKSNYGPTGLSVPLVWQAGVFVPDPEPITSDSGKEKKRAARANTKHTHAVVEFMRAQQAAGVIVVRFADIYGHLLKAGILPGDTSAQGIRELAKYEANRKLLSRTLKALTEDGVVRLCQIPRGSYRLEASQEGSS